LADLQKHGDDLIKNLTDSITLADAAERGVGVSKADSITLADLRSHVVIFLRTLADLITLADQPPGFDGYGADFTGGQTYSDGNHFSDHIAADAFADDGTTEYWFLRHGSDYDQSWIQVQLSVAKQARKIRIQNQTNGPNRIVDFRLLASNNGSDWDTLLDNDNDIWAASAWKEFTFANDTAYLYYRIKVDDGTDPVSFWVGIAEVELMERDDTMPTTIKIVGLPRPDTITLADNWAGVAEYLKTLSDNITLADAVGRGVGLPRADSITLADSRSQVASFLRTFVDSITLADSQSLVSTFLKTLADNITLADLVSTGDDLIKNLADSITLADSRGHVVSFIRAFVDSITLADFAMFPSDGQYFVQQLFVKIVCFNLGIQLGDVIDEPGDTLANDYCISTPVKFNFQIKEPLNFTIGLECVLTGANR
jgi:hypothetical protein